MVFLTRDECSQTAEMARNLDKALKSLGWPRVYEMVDIGALRNDDVHTGYPTPSLLWEGRDIFGLPTPTPPYDVPS